MRSTLSTKRWTSLLAAVLVLLSLAGCGGSTRADKQEQTLFAMDTVMFLTAYGENAQAGLSAAGDVIRELDALLDPEREDSPVWRLNHGETVSDAHVLALLDTAGTVYEASGGALDLTIYPLVEAWGFLDAQYRVPDAGEITALLEQVDFSALETDGESAALPTGMALSFGAVAKGYTAELAVRAMSAAGVEAGILSLGGNVQTLGEKSDGSPWEVAVQDPADTGAALGFLHLGADTAAVTSGGYQRFFEENGTVYHHILDPSTGYPARSGLTGVTVVCPDGALADALSTALFVLGETAALELWRSLGGFEALLVTSDGRVVCTTGLEGRFTLADGSGYTLEIAG